MAAAHRGRAGGRGYGPRPPQERLLTTARQPTPQRGRHRGRTGGRLCAWRCRASGPAEVQLYPT